jgi:peptidoglycan/LPS O-acetylase OafA/YrhL
VSQVSTPTRAATLAKSTPRAVDNTDWLKTAAIVFVLVDHFGHFFMDDDQWWGVFGRFAAPTFFFLMGYAQTRTVPLHWIWLGVILTLLNSWNADWAWVAPNILLSLALIRFARPYVEILVQHHGWAAFAFLVCVLVAALPIAAKCVDYGAEGWLWGLFGLYQRRYVDGGSAAYLSGTPRIESSDPHDESTIANAGIMRLLACFVAALIYVWQEQKEFSFPAIHLAVFILGIAVLSAGLCLFRRGPSRIQPPERIAGVLRFIGRHTLETYAIQLAGSELLVKFIPDLAP